MALLCALDARAARGAQAGYSVAYGSRVMTGRVRAVPVCGSAFRTGLFLVSQALL
jgi:hypothetical protein